VVIIYFDGIGVKAVGTSLRGGFNQDKIVVKGFIGAIRAEVDSTFNSIGLGVNFEIGIVFPPLAYNRDAAIIEKAEITRKLLSASGA